MKNGTIDEILLAREEDGYRGDLDCIKIKTPHTLKLLEEGRGNNASYQVLSSNNLLLGILDRIYGNNGEGRPSADCFTPAEGVKVIWEDDRDYDPNSETPENRIIKTVHITKTANSYNEELNCVEFSDPHELVLKVNRHGDGDIYSVVIGGEVVGKMVSYYGDHGKGGLAEKIFIPSDGVIVKEEEKDDDFE